MFRKIVRTNYKARQVRAVSGIHCDRDQAAGLIRISEIISLDYYFFLWRGGILNYFLFICLFLSVMD